MLKDIAIEASLALEVSDALLEILINELYLNDNIKVEMLIL